MEENYWVNNNTFKKRLKYRWNVYIFHGEHLSSFIYLFFCMRVRLSEITDISSLVSAGLKIALEAEDLLKSVEKIHLVLKKSVTIFTLFSDNKSVS